MKTDLQEKVDILEEQTDLKKLILFNDDFNTFDHVIRCLVSVCDHDAHQAEQCAYIVHYKGKCVVKKGGFDQLKEMKVALELQSLTVEIK